MSTEVRDLLQRAQEAEIQGDTAAAVEHLLLAAERYEDAGSVWLALKMLRHALRLEPERQEVAARMGRLEAQLPPEVEVVQSPGEEAPPESEVAPLEGAEALEQAAREALAHLEQRTRVEAGAEQAPQRRRAGGKGLVEQRGPTLAAAALDAWCSFCCRPGREVGPLVAGPTGAFVCGACVGAALRLLGGDVPSVVPGAGEASGLRSRPLTPALSQGERGTVVAVAEARRLGATRVLLVGPPGAGRSTCLRWLAEERGAAVVTPASAALPPGPLFVDDVEALPAPLLAALEARLAEAPACELVLVAEGRARPAPLRLEGEAGGVALWTSAALREAAPGLPPPLAEHLQQLVPAVLPDGRDAEQLCQQLLARLRPDVRASPALVARLAAEAVRAPRLLHELVALVRRLPAGDWKEAPAVPAKEPLP